MPDTGKEPTVDLPQRLQSLVGSPSDMLSRPRCKVNAMHGELSNELSLLLCFLNPHLHRRCCQHQGSTVRVSGTGRSTHHPDILRPSRVHVGNVLSKSSSSSTFPARILSISLPYAILLANCSRYRAKFERRSALSRYNQPGGCSRVSNMPLLE